MIPLNSISYFPLKIHSPKYWSNLLLPFIPKILEGSFKCALSFILTQPSAVGLHIILLSVKLLITIFNGVGMGSQLLTFATGDDFLSLPPPAREMLLIADFYPATSTAWSRLCLCSLNLMLSGFLSSFLHSANFPNTVCTLCTFHIHCFIIHLPWVGHNQGYLPALTHIMMPLPEVNSGQFSVNQGCLKHMPG